ncbi:alpha/beta fold hydrolase [Buchnera aphidicola]|uniref:alpha/beta fold hydrolase n=1 Tax=Buchnera aphidicola TaxID=9 RepID=UPI0022382BA9|nr:alpha/beta fold hydrolase [Buchnera aphidicola]MCW5197464.1 alpha/beta fold hydrolase [Buchnera aphidicola (Chaitophorus viminalis)]
MNKKKINLVLIYGLGFNKKIWFFLKKKLKKYFNIHTINLPNPNIKNNFYIELNNYIHKKISQIPYNSILIGWSLGGILSTLLTIKIPEKIILLVTISSSPCFLKKKFWPGMKFTQIKKLKTELIYNYKKSIKNFINLQKNKANKKNIQQLKKKVLSITKPNISSIKFNIKILKKIDLRNVIQKIKIPTLRIYGELDSIVPIKISYLLNNLLHDNNSYIIKKSNHAPFISHLNDFCNIFLKFIQEKIYI